MAAGPKKVKKAAKATHAKRADAPKRTPEEARQAVKDALGAAPGKLPKQAAKKLDDPASHKPLTEKQQKAVEDAKAQVAEREAAEKEKAEADAKAAAFAKKWEKWPVTTIDVSRIVCEGRYRGDEDLQLDKMADSLRKYGLMSPVGVQDMGDGSYKLVVGGRRFLAIRDKLNRPSIRAIILDPDTEDGVERTVTLLEMEVEENEQRHNPSVRRKVERFDEIQAMLKKAGRAAPGSGQAPLRNRVAKVVDMSPESKRQADVVFKAAEKDPEKFGAIAESMNKEKTPITTAYKKVIAEKIEFDEEGIPLTTKHLKEVFVQRDQFLHLGKALKLANTQINEVANGPGGERLILLPPDAIKATTTTPDKGEPETKYISVGVADAIKVLAESTPHSQCPPCAEKAGELGKHYKACKMCFGGGHISKSAWDDLVKAGDPSIEKIKKLGKTVEKEKAS